MNGAELSADNLSNAGREEIYSALFTDLILQQTNMALMMLGQIANPETGEHLKDLEAAKVFIDHLEALEFKSRGNQNAEEAQLLKTNLTLLRQIFVTELETP